MTDIDTLLDEVTKLPDNDKWLLVKHLLSLLESDQTGSPDPSDYHEFLRRTYGSLRDTPIEHPPQPPYDEREPLE